MELFPHVKPKLKSSYPYITFALLLSMVLFEAYPVPAPFERGVEIVRSRGYELAGVDSLSQVEANLIVSEVSLKEFLLHCEAMRSEKGSVRILCHMDGKVLFLASPDSEEGQLILCRFR